MVGLPLAVFAARSSPSELSRVGEVLRSSRIVVLEPQRWLNESFPLLSHIEFPADLRQGDWLVVLYRPDCSHCQELLPQLTERFGGSGSSQFPSLIASLDDFDDTADGQHWSKDGENARLALIDLSSQATVQWQVPERIAGGRLSDSWEWFVTPPLSVQLSNGIVTQVMTDIQSIVSGVDATPISETASWDPNTTASHVGPLP